MRGVKRLTGLGIAIVVSVGVAASRPASKAVHTQTDPALTVQVGVDQLITTALPPRPLVEPHLAANPTNPLHFVGGAILSVRDPADRMQSRCVAIATFDGARSWVAHEFDVPRCYDPWVAVLEDGTAIFLALETDNSGAVPHLWRFRSPDGGRTWSTPGHSFGRAHDHGTSIVDSTGGRFHGALYVGSTRVVRDAQGRIRNKTFVARSMDGGQTFAQVTEHEVANTNSGTMTLGVLPDGALLSPVSTFQRYVTDKRGAVSLRQPLYWMIRSDDGGARFGAPMLITDGCAGQGMGFPSLAVDLSKGAYRGRAYFVCLDGLRSGPYVMRSDDGGDRWSDPLPVPKTAPAHPSGQRGIANVAVNRDGILAISWFDRGPDAASKCWNTFVAFSGDGGESFTHEYKVSSQPTCPQGRDNGYAAEYWAFGGDYAGLAAAADGTFHLLWPDAREKHYQLRTAQVRVSRLESPHASAPSRGGGSRRPHRFRSGIARSDLAPR
jgi:hypothetical protein